MFSVSKFSPRVAQQNSFPVSQLSSMPQHFQSPQIRMKAHFGDSFQRFGGKSSVDAAKDRIAEYESEQDDAYISMKANWAYNYPISHLQGILGDSRFDGITKVAQSALIKVLEDPEAAKESTAYLFEAPATQQVARPAELDRADYNPFDAENPKQRALPENALDSILPENRLACAKYELANGLVSKSPGRSPTKNAAYRWRTDNTGLAG